MLRFHLALLPGLLVAGAASAATLTIDDFSLDQGPVTSISNVSASSTIVNDGSFVGPTGTSTRTLTALGDGDPPPTTEVTTAEIGGGVGTFVNGADVTGSGDLVYDLLGGIDLSGYTGFLFDDVIADHSFSYEVSIYDTSSNQSTTTGTLGPINGGDEIILFSEFTGSADFSSVGKIWFELAQSGPNALDFSLDTISATPIPVPASLLLLVSALAGLGFLGRRRAA